MIRLKGNNDDNDKEEPKIRRSYIDSNSEQCIEYYTLT